MYSRLIHILLVYISLAASTPFCMGQSNAVLRIAAAADLRFALDSLVATYPAHDVKIEPIYGASGKLLEQIINGAPFDIFMSADIQYPEVLQARGLTSSEIYPYALGHLVLWSKNKDVSVLGLESLRDPTIRKIAIANPRHAPYGKRAEEALYHYQLFDEVKAKLVFGENISQTAQFVSSGAADVGFIALSLALSPTMRQYGKAYFLIPEESHQPLIQGAVITAFGKDKPHAAAFFEFLKSDVAMEVLEHFGFARP